MNKKAEVVLAIFVFLFVFSCFSIPIIIYAMSSGVTPRQEIGVEIDVEKCPQQVTSIILPFVYVLQCLTSKVGQ